MRPKTLIALIAAALMASPTLAHWTAARPDGHAPIGVMGDHTHHAGEWMISYRYMNMDMEGSRIGSRRVADSQIVSPQGEGFTITPRSMTMAMHMVGLMYAPTDRVTLMAMVPSLDLEMEHLIRNGNRFTTNSSGLGDVRAAALWTVLDRESSHLHLNLGVSAPTGSIDRRDVTPASAPDAVQLPYPMQLGSGTWDAIVGATWLGQSPLWSWGLQSLATLRTGENDRGYTLGDRVDSTGWMARRLGTSWSVSGRLAWSDWGNVEGADPELAGAVAMRMVPTAFPNLRGGSRLDAGAGLNFEVMEGAAKGLRFSAELLVPMSQDLDGPQLETDRQLVFGMQYSW
jgi:hypothetical protein